MKREEKGNRIETKDWDDYSYFIREFEVDPSWINDLGHDFLDYRKRWELASRQHLFNFPLFLEVEASYACNYECIMCPRRFLNLDERGELSMELFDKLFAEAKKEKLASINLSHGGEPLMNKNLPELITKAKEAGILDVMFHTNASLLTKRKSKQIIENGLTKINFSLDAMTEKTYRKIRRGGNYRLVMRNIADFLKIKEKNGKSYPRVRMSFVVMDENKLEMEDFFNYWKYKVNMIAFQMKRNYGILSNTKLKVRDMGFKNKSTICKDPWRLLMISHDGSIMPCLEDYKHEIILGNLKTHLIKECWKSDTMNYIRRMHLEENWRNIPLCKKCREEVGLK